MASGSKTAQFKPELIPRLRTMGCFIILLAAVSLFAGKIRNELAITLLGTVFLVILAYCFIAVFLSGLMYRKKIRHVSISIINELVSTGKEAALSLTGQNTGKPFFWRLPAIIFRCELRLETKDNRVIICCIDPDHEKDCTFPVKERGAYYGEYDRFRVFDAPGFFSLCLPVYRSKSPRLLAYPLPSEDIVPVRQRPGGSEERKEPHYRKSDEFINHRPYVPGDDPRRINWKLYSHAPLGELFVREGESEPPPHSRLLILIDTEVDQSLYTLSEGRRAVDLLCESTLALASEYISRGLDISIGWTGGTIMGNRKEGGLPSAAEISSALALPAALRLPGAELPKDHEDRATLILALPRAFSASSSSAPSASSAGSALDQFLLKREMQHEFDILFLIDSGLGERIPSEAPIRSHARAAELEEAAMVCVNLYNKRPGIHSNLAVVSHAQKGKST